MEIDDYIVASDRELVGRVLEGDDNAFEYLFNRYRDAIHRLFVQRLGGANDADDLLQETFIKVYINLHRYNAEYTFGQWAYTIARNTFIDFVRRRQDGLSIDDRFAAPASSAPTPEESFINLQQRTQIEHYLERLTPSSPARACDAGSLYCRVNSILDIFGKNTQKNPDSGIPESKIDAQINLALRPACTIFA